MSNSAPNRPVTALTFHRFCGALDRRNWIKRLDLYRYVEYPVVWDYLVVDLAQHAHILDVGSATSILPLFFAFCGYKTTSIDINDVTIQKQSHLLAKREGRLFENGLLRFEHKDVCALPYADGTFDAVTAISMLEHIPGDGDSIAMRELARVLKPGGRLILTCPFSTKGFNPGRSPYSSAATQRVYDDQAITTRLIAPTSLDVRTRLYFSNKHVDFEKLWRAIPQVLINGIGWTGLALLCSRVFFAPNLTPGAVGAHGICVIAVK